MSRRKLSSRFESMNPATCVQPHHLHTPAQAVSLDCRTSRASLHLCRAVHGHTAASSAKTCWAATRRPPRNTFGILCHTRSPSQQRTVGFPAHTNASSALKLKAIVGLVRCLAGTALHTSSFQGHAGKRRNGDELGLQKKKKNHRTA